MGFIPPKNENQLGRLTPQEQSEYQRWRSAAQGVAAEKPYLKTEVYTQYLHDYIDAAVAHGKHMAGLRHRAEHARVPMDARTLNAESAKFKNDFAAHFAGSTLPQYGAEGQEAWKELNGKMDPPNRIIRQFYNSEEGGLQIPGIIGALLGGFAAWKVTGGSFDLFGILGIGLGLAMGAVTGNLVGGWLSPKPAPRTPFPAAEAHGQSHTHARGEAPHAAQSRSDKPVATETSLDSLPQVQEHARSVVKPLQTSPYGVDTVVISPEGDGNIPIQSVPFNSPPSYSQHRQGSKSPGKPSGGEAKR